MAEHDTVQIAEGANQQGVRDHNERLILSMIQRFGPLPGAEIAKRSKLSPQTVSIILRSLESDGFLVKGEPQRGRVGKPSVPMALAPEAAYAVGLKIGRRTADVLLTNIHGHICWDSQLTYGYPDSEEILAFVQQALDHIYVHLGDKGQKRLAGVGIAMPSEIWNWHETIGATQEQLSCWQNTDLVDRISSFTELPVYIDNDATAACRAELAYGQGRQYQNFAYFFLGSFVGGGVVLNGSVFEGATNNAGAFGSLPAYSRGAP
ncbi:MAG: ROK family transcriptional regulator, partial [Pseudomonadota bacterium]